MKIYVVLPLFFVLSNSLFAQSQLEVVVKNIKDDKGSIRIALFKDESAFLKKASYGKVVDARAGELMVVFNDVLPGIYGISVFHDEDENGEIDSNFIGIPKEGFGFGNDAMGKFGPPSFEKASITVETGKKTISVGLRYL